jgi:NAD(P)-dependent dehydrogenase (short-subunit alcohol dehydrogenase family)
LYREPDGSNRVRTNVHCVHQLKAGVHDLAGVVAADYANERVRVNTVVPGYTETPLVQSIANNSRQRAGVVDATMLCRPGTAGDVEGIMVYFASDDSLYAPGGMFTVDGGLTAATQGQLAQYQARGYLVFQIGSSRNYRGTSL